ncbi:serine/threonine protein kinase [Blastococcus aurantiacus]|uniref:non-specific serine/threonine protein kinase n=1 Tax=Blastococcus aurantiacus TaxID=1550231 RepID=A0A1G7JB28_9ACTN|nr:serine/threonine-protein kinase [Blastococcus aurantiacus]SDF22140.1 serine/threonine protein kinase [Blastococcus aurantiacus]
MQTTRALGSRYVLERQLGSGAMGQVWAAVDQRTGEEVAAKLLRPEFARDPEILTRFVQERSILLDLVHPNVVRVRDLVIEGDDLAIVMDLVRGADLRARLRAAGTLPVGEAVRIAADVLEALATAHTRGVLHRDVKPDNVLLTDAEPPAVLLSDFSIARLAQETTVRMTGVLGTPDYMAPEIFTAETVSAASDVYGAGIVLYELLAGRPPFAGGGTGYAVANRHVTAEPPPIEGLPAPVDAVLQGLLAKDPARRPSAAAAAAALRDLLPAVAEVGGLPVIPEPQAWASARVGEMPAFGVLGHRPAADLDPGATNIKASAAAPAELPVAAPAEDGPWVAPHAAPGDDTASAQTQLRAPRPQPVAPAPAATDEENSRTGWLRDRRTWWTVGGSLVAVGAVIGVVALTSGDDGARGTRGGTATDTAVEEVTAIGPTGQLPSGLSVVREAAYDPEAGSLTTTVTWSAENGIAGPLFEAVPAPEDGAPCPEVSWSVLAVRDVTPGVATTACGWQVPVDVPAGGDATASYTVAFPGGDDVDASALRERLVEQGTATDAALEGLVATAVYPAQRLEALEVQIGDTVRVAGTVDLVVLPVWRGTDAADNISVVFSSRTPAPTVLLRQLGGELEVRTDDCTGSLAFVDRVPYANTVGSRCTVSVRLGDLESRSRTFDVLQNSAG